MNSNINQMVDDVLQHANDNYTKGGWDYVVECWDREDIAAEIDEGNCSNSKAAIEHIKSIVGIFEEQRFAAQAASGEYEYYGIVEKDGELVRKSSLED